MDNLSDFAREDLERTLIKVKFKKAIDDLLFQLEEKDLLDHIKKELSSKEAFSFNLFLDPSPDMKELYEAIGAKNIDHLNKELVQDRFFSRVIKILDQEGLAWEIRQNSLRKKTLKGQILQLRIRKKGG